MAEQVEVSEDESTGKRTIKTTSICWGNKLSLLVNTPFFDPRLPANPNDPDLDFSQAQVELNTEADWQKVHQSVNQTFNCTFCQRDYSTGAIQAMPNKRISQMLLL